MESTVLSIYDLTLDDPICILRIKSTLIVEKQKVCPNLYLYLLLS